MNRTLLIAGTAFGAIYLGTKLLGKKETLPGDKDPSKEPVEPVEKDTQPAPNPLASQVDNPSGISAKYPNGIPEPSPKPMTPVYTDDPRTQRKSLQQGVWNPKLGGRIPPKIWNDDVNPGDTPAAPAANGCCNSTGALDRFAGQSLGGTRLF